MAEQLWKQLYFDNWVGREGLDLIKGHFVKDVYNTPLKPWARTGGDAVHIKLDGTGDMNAAYVQQIPAGKQLEPQRYMWEELVFVLSGRGSTTVSYPGMGKSTFEWGKGSLFVIPLNAQHQHFNTSGTEPARYIAVTTAPIMMNLIRSDEYLFNSPAAFPDRYDGSADFFNGEVRNELFTGWDLPRKIAFSNFFADIHTYPLRESDRTKGARGQSFEIAHSVLAAHTTELPGGTYSTIHRHGPGAHVLWLTGEGYTLMWPDGEEDNKVLEFWETGDIIVPPSWWWHHHAVTSPGPAQDLALRFSAIGNQVHKLSEDVMKSTRTGGNQMMIEDFPPALRRELHELFERECVKRGTVNRMAELVPMAAV
jgi:mannose-6-phosphate isomerase-like protein (cupin superfamily)